MGDEQWAEKEDGRASGGAEQVGFGGRALLKQSSPRLRSLTLPVHLQGHKRCSLLRNRSDSTPSPAPRLNRSGETPTSSPPAAAYPSAAFSNLGAKLKPFKVEDFNGFSNKKSLRLESSRAESWSTPSLLLLYFRGIQGSTSLPPVRAILFERCLIAAEPHRVDARRGI